LNADASQYFDTHRINQYHIQNIIPGLTDKATYILTDFINYIPSDINDDEQYHAKYVNRPNGLQEGDEFFIPSLALRKISQNKLAGYTANKKDVKPIIAVEPENVAFGTIVAKMQNTYYNGSTATTNIHDNDVLTIALEPGEMLNSQPISGKIFVNFVEDGFTMSREDYNKATIQVVPQDDLAETSQTRMWQYSTTRLERSPKISGISEFGQTVPTNGGGGPLIQAPTNSSNGVLRSKTDATNSGSKSDIYATESEEKYPIQEIPVLSMTWLGLQWLAE
jgi:hypothetical protein